MGDPRRLLEEGASDFEARLLAAGRKDAPSRASRRRILWGLGVGGLLPFSLAWPAKAAWLQVGARGVLLRAALGGTIGAVAVWTGMSLSAGPSASDVVEQPLASPPAAIVALPSDAVAPIEPAAEPEPAPPEAPSADVNVPPPSRRPAPASAEASRLSEELSHLERARRTLAAGEAKRTLRLLDEYAKKFERPRLGAEASVLRVEALVASGDRGRATQLARAALAKQPNGPYARRLRSLIGEPEEPRKPEP